MSYNVYYSPGWKKFLMYRKMNCGIKWMNIYFIFLGQLGLTWMRFNFFFGFTIFFFFSFLIQGIFRWLIVDVGCNWWSSAIVFFRCFFCCKNEKLKILFKSLEYVKWHSKRSFQNWIKKKLIFISFFVWFKFP